MSELLPTIQAGAVQASLLDYLTTTFALTDDDARRALAEFLGDPDNGLFKGPYMRLRLPFRPAEPGWRETLEWYSGFAPYGHQAAAFARLSSAGIGPDRPRPQPTLVTTGTGSGKTEAFLVPILDHVLRAKRAGITGTKAIVLYPMNALANDQAGRLSKIIASDEALGGVTAALYTGQKDVQRTKVTVDGLVTDRQIIRSDPPDIMLTNYKMLDQMLLRHADAGIWSESARSLQYLVLDEFHTYDGAQGTDVSMLLRRLGLALKSHWAADDSTITADDRSRPLGQVTPVATSATLGHGSDPSTMLEFASTVFGETFGADSVITETRLNADEWIGDAPARMKAAGHTDVEPDASWLAERARLFADLDRTSGRRIAEVVLGALYGLDQAGDEPAANGAAPNEPGPALAGASGALLLDLIKAHPLTRRLLDAAAQAIALPDLVAAVLPGESGAGGPGEEYDLREAFVVALLAAFSHVRAATGRAAASVDLHLWVRELTRIDRLASAVPRYRWSDDGESVGAASDDPSDPDTGLSLPALFCRHCGRSGWGVVLAPTGSDLDTSDELIRRRKMARDARYRPILHAPAEGDQAAASAASAAGGPEPEPIEGLRWLAVQQRQLLAKLPSDVAEVRSGGVLPVLTHLGMDAGDRSLDDTCPACGQKDGIRWLGSAIATLLSVSMSTLFGAEGIDEAEKKALVFTDSVQDAAHRAGFVQSRSYSLTLRAVLREAIGDAPMSLDTLVEQVIANAGEDRHRRYRIVPPDLVDKPEFAPFWQKPRLRDVPAGVRNRVKLRLLLDAELEFGLQSRTGRTLERTGSVAAEVAVGPATLLRAADQAIEEAGGLTLPGLDPPSAQAKTAWVRGVLERMRERGAIEHKWFNRYQQDDGGRYSIWGGRPRSDGMPAFPAGRAAPGFPRFGARQDKPTDLDPVASPQSWYALWTAKNLALSPADGGKLARLLLQRLVHLDVLGAVTTKTGAQVCQLPPSSVVVVAVPLSALKEARVQLICPTCQTLTPASETVVDQLAGAPCLVARCAGRLRPAARGDNFYRRLYASKDMRRVVAREHTSLLDDDVRKAYEDAFKFAHDQPQAPNVLVATPTLEMGIDIGDLSTVMLAGLPRTVASYLQRIGRAGRLTGNSLNLSFVTGRGDQLPRLGDPLSVINGEVRPPATYLDAEEILRRQYVASIADLLARDPQGVHPKRAEDAIGGTGPGTYLGTVIELAEGRREELLARFLDSFDGLSEAARDSLREWGRLPSGAPPGDSPLARRLHLAAQRWNTIVETLEHRREAIADALPQLKQVAEVVDADGRVNKAPGATDEDVRAYRSAKASLRLTEAQLAELRGEYWIGVLEEHGVLPNYTLLGDGVELDVALSYVDPDSGEYSTDSYRYRRGGALALREFAPGATFYAGGHRLEVDAIELGHEASDIRVWIYCPDCGYARDFAIEGAAAACPRCGTTAIADIKQRFDVVELERVYCAMRRDDAAITDDRDERHRELYTLATAADIEPGNVTREWYVENYGFGAKHLRDQTIRWVNVGRAGSKGVSREVAGGVFNPALFRVCAACGQLDTASGVNLPSEHRPWCPNRKITEERVRNLALSRTLRTEGLVMRLPHSVTLGDAYALPSLSAAVLLGLRERIGGAPDHLQIENIVDPTPDADAANPQALLLHDVVPGGTGYLAELADPAAVWSILRKAWVVLRDCPCQTENRLACHRCLLPFAAPHLVRLTSRAAGERHLRDILTAGGDGEPPAEMGWTCTQTAHVDDDPESLLEQQFRAVLGKRLEALGATVKEQPTSVGNRWVVTIGGGRVWTLEPQQNMLGCKPDFVLRCNQTGIPDVAIFTDGWRYHASPSCNRLADDAAKRAILRQSGCVVLAVTWQDLAAAQDPLGTPPAAPWHEPAVDSALIAAASGELNSASIGLVAGGPIDLLLRWIQDPRPLELERLANWLPLFLAARGTRLTFDAGAAAAAVEALDGKAFEAAEGGAAWLWSQGTVAFAANADGTSESAVEVALLLDDRPERLATEEAKAAWRDWLRLSNLLNLRLAPTTIGTRTLGAAAVVVAAAAPAPDGSALPPQWQEMYDNAVSQSERDVLFAMAEVGFTPLPRQGEEVAGGIPLALSWPDRKVAMEIGLQEGEITDLTERGWTVITYLSDDAADAVRKARANVPSEGRT